MATKPDALAVDLPEASWSAAVQTLEGGAAATLVCHVAPDGDALGSMLALARVLRDRGCDVTCTWGDDDVGGADRRTAGCRTSTPSSRRRRWHPSPMCWWCWTRRAVTASACSARRGHGAELVVIDHHAHNSGLDGVQLIDPSAAATAVIVEELLRRLAPSIDVDTATLLYVGLGDGHRIVPAPRDDACGARSGRATARRRRRSVDDLAAAVGHPVVRLQHRPRCRAVPVAAGGAEPPPVAAGCGPGRRPRTSPRPDSGSTRSSPSSTSCAQRARRMSPRCSSRTATAASAVSTRSRGATDVGAVCAALGGGGHKLAAGFTSHDDVETTAKRLRAELAGAPAP